MPPITVQDILLAITIIGGILVYSKTRLPRQTIQDLQAYVATQKLQIEELIRRDKENIKALGVLEGQIQVYKELPLRELAEGIKAIGASNNLILNELQKSSVIAAEDRDILVKGAHSTEEKQ